MKARLNPGSKFVKAGVSVLALSWLAAVHLNAAEITGKVRDASGDTATVVTEGDAIPAVGDSSEIFFKLPGADEEISVGSGTVAAVDGKAVQIKIKNATGTVAKDQLARIKSGTTPQTLAASPSPAASPSTPAAPGSSIIGDWIAITPDGTMSFSFKADGTLLWVVEEAKYGQSTGAKYRIDPSTQPQGIEMFDFEDPDLRDQNYRGIFEVQSDSRLKLYFQDKPEAPPLKEFPKEMIIFSRATSPVVRSNKPPKPTPTPSVAPTPPSPKPKAPDASPSGTAAIGSSIAGDWTSTFPEGTKISFSFKEDGTLLWVVEDAKYAQSTLGKYRVDPSTQPQGIEFFDIEEGEVKGQRMRGIFDLQSDGRLKLDFPKGPEAPPLKEFTEKMLVFSKATSPVVRPNKPAPPAPPPPSPDEVLVNEAVLRYERGDYAGAMEGIEKAIALNPKNARAIFYRGLCFHSKKDYAPAIADFEKAMELDPSMKLEDLILKTRAARGTEREKAAESPVPATPTATPARSRKKAKLKP